MILLSNSIQEHDGCQSEHVRRLRLEASRRHRLGTARDCATIFCARTLAVAVADGYGCTPYCSGMELGRWYGVSWGHPSIFDRTVRSAAGITSENSRWSIQASDWTCRVQPTSTVSEAQANRGRHCCLLEPFGLDSIVFQLRAGGIVMDVTRATRTRQCHHRRQETASVEELNNQGMYGVFMIDRVISRLTVLLAGSLVYAG